MKQNKILYIFIFLIPNILFSKVSGYHTAQTIISEASSTSRQSIGLWHLANVNRLNWLKNSSGHTFEFGFELSHLYESAADTTLLVDWKGSERDYRIFDLKNVLFEHDFSEIRRYVILQNLDRLSYTFRNEDYEIIVGRQQIALGTAKLFSPIDIFTPFDLVTLNTEERKGVDAIRFRIAIGDMGEAEVAGLFGEEFKDQNSALFLRYIHFLDEIELSPIIGRYKSALTIGFDFLMTIKGANLYFETLASSPQREDDFLRTTAGFELQLSEFSFLAFEYHHNGAGTTDKENYQNLSDTFFYESGAIGFYGQDYLGFLGSYQSGDLHTVGINSFVNLNDKSLLISPSWTLSLSDNSTFNIAGFIGLGDDGTSTTGVGKNKKTTKTSAATEFSNYGKSIHSKFIYYF